LILSNLLTQIPVVAVCIVGVAMLAGRRASAPTATAWAMGGFGLTAAISLLMPLVYGLLSFIQMRGDMPIGSISWIYPLLGIFSSLLHTAGYVLLLIAFLQFLRPAAPRTS
jgi:hypothetical protein